MYHEYRESRILPKSLTPEEFKNLVLSIPQKDKQARVAFLLAYGSGMRLNEVLATDITKIKGSYIEVRGAKYGVDRVVPLPKGWRPYMLKILPIQKSARTLERKFKKYALAAQLSSQYTFHSLRHSFGTRMVEAGVPLNQIQLLLGHRNIATTSVYTRARPEDALKSYENLF